MDELCAIVETLRRDLDLYNLELDRLCREAKDMLSIARQDHVNEDGMTFHVAKLQVRHTYVANEVNCRQAARTILGIARPMSSAR